jgi:FkbM family methyltransferase
MGRVASSLARDARFLRLGGVSIRDRVVITIGKYGARARSSLRRSPKSTCRVAGRTYHMSDSGDLALLQRVLIDTHEYLEVFGLIGKAGVSAVDVGAHNGETSIAWSIFMREPQIHAFEPDPVSFQNAERNLRGVTSAIFAVGLSDHPGEAPFDLDRGHGGDATFVLEESARSAAVLASVVRGDDVLSSVDVDLIKIDVEGFERHVVEGLDRTLSRCRYLTIETALQRPKDHRFHELAAALSKHRFELIGVGRPHGEPAAQQDAVDLHFVRVDEAA